MWVFTTRVPATLSLMNMSKLCLISVQVDVEGFEPSVFRSATALFDHHHIANIHLEYTPGAADKLQDWELLQSGVLMLLE